VGVAQPYIKLGDIENNLQEIFTLSTQAAAAGCRIALFPETALHGYSFTEMVKAKALKAKSSVVDRMMQHAENEKIVMAVGSYEKDEDSDAVYISHFICFPDGQLIVQRKHYGHQDPAVAKAPYDQKVFEIDNVKFSLVICADNGNPNIQNQLAESGVQIKLSPTAGGGPRDQGFYRGDLDDDEKYKIYLERMSKVCFPTKKTFHLCRDYSMALATSNLATGDDGADFVQVGHSFIIDSDGSLISLIPGSYLQEHHQSRFTWGDITPLEPRITV